MTKRIIYQNDNGGVALITPAMNCGLTVEEIARKDVPAGARFAILDTADVPTDFTFFDAWEAEHSNLNDGVGIGANAWFIEKYKAEIATINAEVAPVVPETLVAASKDQAGFPDDFTPEQIDAAYDELVAQVAALNDHNTAAHAEAVAQWEASKAQRIEQLNKQIAVQEEEMAA